MGKEIVRTDENIRVLAQEDDINMSQQERYESMLESDGILPCQER